MMGFDLFGQVLQEAVYWCDTCNVYLPASQFYEESNSKKSIFRPVRCQCIPCWNKLNGKVRSVANTESFTLLEFTTAEKESNSAIEFIMEYFINHGILSYDETKKKLIASKVPMTKGVYAFVDLANKRVYKIGKADGDQGFAARFRKYEVEEFVHEELTNSLKDIKLSLLYYPIKPTPGFGLFGEDIEISSARPIERELSIKCRKEGHPMTLSKQD